MTEDPCELNGIGSGPSPPTYPLANSLSEVDDFTELDGAKAVADPASAATVNKNLVMVMIFLLFECVKKNHHFGCSKGSTSWVRKSVPKMHCDDGKICVQPVL